MRSSGRGTFRLFLAFLCTGWYDERMKKRVAYYVSRKNPLIWLAALVMLASAALRIANVCGKGADARTVWLLVVLPVTACVFYVLNILCNGKDRFYRSSVPVFLLAIYYGIKVTLVSPYLWLTFVFWIAYLAIAAFYAVTVSGHVKSTIPLLLLLLAAFAVLAAMHEKEFSRENWDQLRTILPDLLFLLGGILKMICTSPLSSMALTAMLGLTGLPMGIAAIACFGGAFSNGILFAKLKLGDRSSVIAVMLEPLTQAHIITRYPIPVYASSFIGGALSGIPAALLGIIDNAPGTASPIPGLLAPFAFNPTGKVLLALALSVVMGVLGGLIGATLFKRFTVEKEAETGAVLPQAVAASEA